jgi:hypothetical protein
MSVFMHDTDNLENTLIRLQVADGRPNRRAKEPDPNRSSVESAYAKPKTANRSDQQRNLIKLMLVLPQPHRHDGPDTRT